MSIPSRMDLIAAGSSLTRAPFLFVVLQERDEFVVRQILRLALAILERHLQRSGGAVPGIFQRGVHAAVSEDGLKDFDT